MDGGDVDRVGRVARGGSTRRRDEPERRDRAVLRPQRLSRPRAGVLATDLAADRAHRAARGRPSRGGDQPRVRVSVQLRRRRAGAARRVARPGLCGARGDPGTAPGRDRFRLPARQPRPLGGRQLRAPHPDRRNAAVREQHGDPAVRGERFRPPRRHVLLLGDLRPHRALGRQSASAARADVDRSARDLDRDVYGDRRRLRPRLGGERLRGRERRRGRHAPAHEIPVRWTLELGGGVAGAAPAGRRSRTTSTAAATSA